MFEAMHLEKLVPTEPNEFVRRVPHLLTAETLALLHEDPKTVADRLATANRELEPVVEGIGFRLERLVETARELDAAEDLPSLDQVTELLRLVEVWSAQLLEPYMEAVERLLREMMATDDAPEFLRLAAEHLEDFLELAAQYLEGWRDARTDIVLIRAELARLTDSEEAHEIGSAEQYESYVAAAS